MTYQHDDEVIEAARKLKQALLDDAPYGNEDVANDWFMQNYYQVEMLARQKTVTEEVQKAAINPNVEKVYFNAPKKD